MECSTQILFGCKHCKKCFVSEYEEAMFKAQEAEEAYWAEKEARELEEMGL